uniref:Uncharacterized protein n=1 Tax=Anguilla anguilla TaxID=7936 RepID=A0A0E9PXB5_ANGAN
MVLNKKLSLSENIMAVFLACRIFLYNIWRICPFLSTYSTQLLVQIIGLLQLPLSC